MFMRIDGLSRLLYYFAYCILSRTYSSQALLFFPKKICTRRNMRAQRNSSCVARLHDVMKKVMTEFRARTNLHINYYGGVNGASSE